MKKKILAVWGAFVLCVAITIGLWFAMNKTELNYKEVEAKVVSSETKRLKNKKNGSSYDFYEVKVEYEGKEYELGNVHSAASYYKGKKVKAYLSNDKLYANIEGVKTSTSIATLYFIFLFGSFGMLILASMYTSKLSQDAKKEKSKGDKNKEK